MALSFIELAILLLLAVLVFRGGTGHVLYWLGALAVMFVALGMFWVIASRERSYLHSNATRKLSEHAQRQLDERIARGETIPDAYGGYGRAPMEETVVVKRSASMLLLLALPLGAFAAIRAMRGQGARGGKWAAAGALLLASVVAFGFFGVSSRTVRVPAPPMAYPPSIVAKQKIVHEPAAGTAPQLPMDELWDRLTAPRIEVAAVAAEEAEPAAADAAAEGEAGVVAMADEAPAADAASEETAVAEVLLPAASTAEPPPRPEWVTTPPKLAGPVRRVVVESGPYATLGECYEALRREMRMAVATRVEDLASESVGRPVGVPDLEVMRVGNVFIDRELLADQYVETGQASFGEMQNAWALLEFDRNDDQKLLRAWQGYARRDGIRQTALVAGLVVSVLALIYGLLQVDTWTRGYYSKRLFLGVPAAIIGLIMLIDLMK
ncbi:MAG TPA: hypothetical protein PKC18_02605 [Lacipirellulaceae bacterium]|nr:hypothetical protein [Lacipirellulaceae bacterium]